MGGASALPYQERRNIMPAEYLGTGIPDGAIMGRSATEKISFYGATPVVQQATAASGTDAATTQALANALKLALNNLGFTA
jgi:hypothetical protein